MWEGFSISACDFRDSLSVQCASPACGWLLVTWYIRSVQRVQAIKEIIGTYEDVPAPDMNTDSKVRI